MDAMGAGSMRTSLLRSALQVTRRARSFLPLPLRNSASLKSRGLSVETWLTQEDLRLPSLKVVKLWSHHNLQQHDLVDYPSLIPPQAYATYEGWSVSKPLRQPALQGSQIQLYNGGGSGGSSSSDCYCRGLGPYSFLLFLTSLNQAFPSGSRSEAQGSSLNILLTTFMSLSY